MMRAALVATVAMVAMTLGPAASGQTPPANSPPPQAPPGYEWIQTPATVAASTNRASASVDYEARDGVQFSPTGIRLGGGRKCVGMSPEKAGVTYRLGNSSTTPNWLLTPYTGAGPLPMVGKLPVADANGLLPDNAVQYIVVCSGVPVGWGVWVPRPRGATVPSPQEIARQVSGEIPMPSVRVGINPEVGLAGMEGWFWVDGYSGQPLVETRDALGRTVTVRATPTAYVWDFGDGSEPLQTTNLGQPYPHRSEIRHVYRKMSEGYPVRIAFFFNVAYQVDGSSWTELPPIERVATATYKVGQIRTIVVDRG